MSIRRYLFLLLMVVAVFALPASALALPGDTELKLGSQGEDVRLLQEKLQRAGFYPEGELTGHFGMTTLAAVMAFEKENNLTVDGRVTAEDWKVMFPEDNKKSDNVVLGYYVKNSVQDKLSYNSLANNGDVINFSAKFCFAVKEDGNLVGSVPQDGMDIARKNNVQPLLVVHNMANGIDSKSVSKILNSPANMNRLVQNINLLVNQYNFAGVNIDFEGVPPQDREKYNTLLRELRNVLHSQGKLLTVAIPAKTMDMPNNSWSGAYNYQVIGQLVDYAVLMTYDEHWFGGSPGPIASAPWVNKVLKYASSQMPREKILMGVAAYGYDWSPKGTQTILWRNAYKLQQYGPIQWDNTSSSPYIKYYTDVQHEAWFENKYSLAIKLDLAKQYNIAGIAVWRLGLEDDTFWQTVRQKFD